MNKLIRDKPKMWNKFQTKLQNNKIQQITRFTK